MIVKLNHADQDAAGALRMYKSVTASRVAKGVAHELAAGFDDLITGVVQIFNLKTNVVEARAARGKIFLKM